jgi:hypothetical protein
MYVFRPFENTYGASQTSSFRVIFFMASAVMGPKSVQYNYFCLEEAKGSRVAHLK